MEKLYDRIDWHNNTTPALNETNLNRMSKALDDLDDRVILIAGDVLVTVPQLREMLEDCTELEARLEAMTENPPYIGANGHWYIWDTDEGAYVDSGIDASITVEIADITMLDPSATPYVTNTGTDTDPVFHLFIPRGQPGKGISNIAKTGTSGYVDTYTITYTDGTTTTYTVTNGRNTDQMPSIPTASASLVGTIYQYVGASTSSYTHGFYYECVNDGGTYKWVNIPVGNDPVAITSTDPYTYRQSKGNLADMEIVGASVGWSQLVQNGNFASTSGWNTQSGSLSVSNNNALVTCTTDNKRVILEQTIRPILNHKYLVSCKIKFSENSSTKKYNIGFYDNFNASTNASTSEQKLQFVFQINSNDVSYGKVWFSVTNAALNDTLTVSECNVIDLTLLFGSTIADAIYAMEQATAGAGVAFFRKYFSKDYYAYDAGSIQSVCVGSRKVVGKNLCENLGYSEIVNGVTFTVNPDGSVSANGTASADAEFIVIRTTDPVPISRIGNYIVSISDTNGSSSTYQMVTYARRPTSGYVFDIVTGNKEYIVSCDVIPSQWRFAIRIKKNYNPNGKTFYPMIRSAVVENGTWEPYNPNQYEYPFDSTKELRGLFNLVNGELKASGDTYYGDGSITRTWTKLSNQTGAIGDTITLTGLKTNGTVLCSDGLISEVGTISGTTLTLTKAISGADFVYEKATPTTEAAQPYQNPQRAYIDGTEEFTDGLTRDVMIPVGNNSVYQQDKVLPSIEDYVDAIADQKADISAIGTNEDKATASQAYTVGQHFYKDGKFCTVIANIASGGTFTLNTNYVEGTIAEALEASARIDIDPSAATIAAYPVGTMYLVTQ